MTDLLSVVITTGWRACPALLLVFAARLVLCRAPAAAWRPLWWGAFFRLACPFALFLPIPVPREAGQVLQLQEAGDRAMVMAGAGYDPVTLPGTGIQLVHASRGLTPEGVLAAVWLAGCLGMLAWGLVSFLRFSRCLVGSTRVGGNIWQGDDLPAPVTVGVLRPRVYLPSALEGWERGYGILHERAHIRWGDPLFKLLAFLVLSVHWYHPLAWAAFLLACRDLETACDQGVLSRAGEKARQEYAAALLRLSTGKRMPAGGPLAFGEGETKKRIRRVMAYRRFPSWAGPVAGGMAAAALAVAILGPVPDVYAAEKPPAFTPYDNFSAVTHQEGAITFPAYREGREDYNAAVYDIQPFQLSVRLPEGWTVRVPPLTERRTSHGFTPLWLYQGEERAGSIAYNTFEVYPDVPPEGFYRMVYNQLMLGSVINWDNEYTVARDWGSGCSATVQITESQGAAGPTEARPGILAYDRDQLVYVAIELENGRLSGQEVWELAESLEIYR